MAAIITEIRYRNGSGFSPDEDFVEVAVPAGADISDVSVVVYNPNGTIRSVNPLSSATSVNTVFGKDVYVINARINRNGAVSLEEDGVSTAFVSFDAAVTATEGAASGQTSTIIGTNGNDATASLVSTDGSSFTVETDPNPTVIPCFTPGVRIDTLDGPRPIETLARGDLVLTADYGPVPVVWTRDRTFASGHFEHYARHRPILIPRGALGAGVPTHDMQVSPQHRMLISGPIVERMCGVPEVFAPAGQLCGMSGIRQVHPRAPVRYIHVLMEKHCVIFANGAPSESLNIGPQFYKTLPRTARVELTKLTRVDDLPLARMELRGRRLRKLLERHIKNSRALLEPVRSTYKIAV